MSSWARVGVKCVCVGSSNVKPLPGSYYCSGMRAPRPGIVYTITRVFFDPHYNLTRIVVNDAPNPDLLGRDWGWHVEQFRPLITKTQEEDVAMFKSLVTGALMGVEA